MKKIILILSFIILYAFTTGDSRSVYDIPHLAGALCSGDLDNDGDEDIIVNMNSDPYSGWHGLYIMENDGKGNFIYLDSISWGGAGPVFSEFVFDNEYPDILTLGNGLDVISNNGNGYELQSFPMGDQITDFDIGDFDNDGDIDVAFISGWNRYLGILYNINKNHFRNPEYFYLGYNPANIATGDINNDGKSEIAISGGSKSYVYLLHDAGIDSIALEYNAEEIEMADLDNDGYLDIITYANWYDSHISVYRNTTEETFELATYFSLPEYSSSMSIADFDNNGYKDILFLPYLDGYDYLIMMRNYGDFDFNKRLDISTEMYPNESGRHMFSSDFDNNGHPDIACTHRIGHMAPSGILDIKFNDGNANFFEDPLESVDESLNKQFVCFKNYPNPFITSTTFEFILEKTSNIEISVNNLNGELVKSINKKNMKGGEHTIKWDGLNNAYQACRPGPYIAYLKVNGTFMQSIKLIIN